MCISYMQMESNEIGNGKWGMGNGYFICIIQKSNGIIISRENVIFDN